ncbi:MAG: HPF/RaiA family ribosome-associated protein [Leptospiraceae bacterium]|nr:HPF/RaiA family ribosome-associated protein [Leptospiraceae bacterium]MCB1304831.1 HPF/RaiA family ribosome-associated protein [Leptospiraceae bacterium]
MHVEINTDNHIEGKEGLLTHVEDVVRKSMSHFSGQVTRVEVFLKDENAAKAGPQDKKCTMEARISSHQPLAVSYEADNLHTAIDGAADKLKRAVEHTLGKLHRQGH